MTTSSDIDAAVERLRTRAYGECNEDMHQHPEDCKLLAHAYLELGKRQPGYPQRDVFGNRTALITTFIREVQG